GDGRKGSGQVIQLEVCECQVKVNQGKTWFDLGRRFIVKAREWKLTSVEIKIPQVVMRLNVPRFMFKRQREVIQCGRDVTQILIYDTEIAVSLRDIVAVGYSLEV